jgi:DMATS type aromatic prenyltransferase
MEFGTRQRYRGGHAMNAATIAISEGDSSLTAAALKRLQALWGAIYGVPCPPRAHTLVSTMLEPWGSQSILRQPAWRSDIGDDHSPFEFSLVHTSGTIDLRFLVEAQGGSDWASMRAAGLRLNDKLQAMGADLRRFHLVEELFLPQVAELRSELDFALWHTITLWSDPPRVKCYFYPRVRGSEQSNRLVRIALERLGLSFAWSTVEAIFARFPSVKVRLLCLDLEETAAARFKVYVDPNGATLEDLEWIAQWSPAYVRGEISDFCRAITGSGGPYWLGQQVTRLPMFYLAFTRNDPTPSDVTLQLPVRFYVPDDAVATARIAEYMRSRRVDSAAYERAVRAVAYRPLRAGAGLNAWVSLRTGTDPAFITVYLSAELYHVSPIRTHLLEQGQSRASSSV